MSGPSLDVAQKLPGSRPARRNPLGMDVSLQRELQAVEDRYVRQMQRFQDQSQRLMEMMVQPLESKLASMEGKHKAMESQQLELHGGIRGLREAFELQVQRTSAAEARLLHWRQGLEESLRDWCALRHEAGSGGSAVAPIGNMATRQEILDVADMLRQELKRLVAKAVPQQEAAQQLSQRTENFEVAAIRANLDLDNVDDGYARLQAAAEDLRQE